LRGLVLDLGLQSTVALHGYQTDNARDALLSRAWLTTSTSIAEGWGCSVIEAAAWGVPCVALNVPGIRDSVVANRTGWLVNTQDFSTSIVRALNTLADENPARQIAATCQDWARCFSWDRSAELLAGVLLERIGTIDRLGRHAASQRLAHSDIGAFARFNPPHGLDLRSALRSTDEIAHVGDEVSVLLAGCDELDAAAVLHRLGVFDASLRLAVRHDLLAGPGAPNITNDLIAVQKLRTHHEVLGYRWSPIGLVTRREPSSLDRRRCGPTSPLPGDWSAPTWTAHYQRKRPWAQTVVVGVIK
jgi:Glycosyl transferases group 1